MLSSKTPDCFKFVCLRKINNILVVKLLYLKFSQLSCFLHLSGRLVRELVFFFTTYGLNLDFSLSHQTFLSLLATSQNGFLAEKNNSVNVILPLVFFHLLFQWCIDKISINCILFIFDLGSSEISGNKRVYWCLYSGFLWSYFIVTYRLFFFIWSNCWKFQLLVQQLTTVWKFINNYFEIS